MGKADMAYEMNQLDDTKPEISLTSAPPPMNRGFRKTSRQLRPRGALMQCAIPMVPQNVKSQPKMDMSKSLSFLQQEHSYLSKSEESYVDSIDFNEYDNQIIENPETTKINSNVVKTDDIASSDFTAMPKILDSMIQKYDKGSAIRSTIIKTDNTWTMKRQENLLSKAKSTVLSSDDRKSEKERAFDLLDALCRSGSLPISYSELHVLICVSHCFEKDVMGTIIEDNINPIEKLEISALLMASAVHNVAAITMVHDDNERKRLASSFPMFLLQE